MAAGYVSLFLSTPPSKLANRTIGLNELSPTGKEVLDTIAQRNKSSPKIARCSVQDANRLAVESGDLAALVRKKLGDGTHGVGDDIWDVESYQKLSITDLIVHGAMEREAPYVPESEATRSFLDEYFADK